MNAIRLRLLLLALPVLALTSSQASAAPAALPREDIRVFSQDPKKVDELRRAVFILKHRDFDNATSWFNMAAIHEIDNDDPDVGKVPPAIQALWHQCHNDPYLFFLWHRAYVWSMEKLMQDALGDPDFRIPYWDWYSDPSLPAIFRNEFLDAARRMPNPLYIRDRNSGVNEGRPIWTPQVSTDYSNPDFEGFQNSLSSGEHSTIHLAVGNDANMASPQTAARDPIFFLHHVNIDRLLPVWLKIDPANHHPPDQFPAWLPSVYRFPLTSGGNTTPTIQDLALASDKMMGYFYADINPPTVPSPPLPTLPATVAGGSDGKLRFMADGLEAVAAKQGIGIGGPGTVILALRPSTGLGIKALGMVEEPKPITSLNIVLEGLSLVDRPSGVLGYRVFLDLPSQTAGKQFADYFLGSISLFDLAHGGHHGHKPLRFPATDQFTKLMKVSSSTPSQVSISIIPILAPGVPPPARTVLTIGEIRLEASDSLAR
jgi:hypothetical protein